MAENIERKKEIAKKWYDSHKEIARKRSRDYYHKHKEERKQYHKDYVKTPMGRASYLAAAYAKEDLKYNRGNSDITAKWIVDNIFSKSCVYCGENDWTKLGCNRKNNDLPHIIDNVEPCCGKCNLLLQQSNRDSLGRFK